MVPRERYVGRPGRLRDEQAPDGIPNRSRGPREVSVVKVGRKWAEIDIRGYRIDKDSLFIDGHGYTSPGRCYLSRDEFEASDMLEKSWSQIRGFIDRQYRVPDGLTLEKVQEIARLLCIDVSPTEQKA